MSMRKALRAISRTMAAITMVMVGVTVNQSAAQPVEVKPDMAAVYAAFKALQPYMANRNEFVAPEHTAEIEKLLETMSTRFHRVENLAPRYSTEPGFSSTLKVLNEMLDDVSHRFKEGKKEYALWRLKTSYNYCVSCHTRFEVQMDFSDPDASLSRLSHYERGEFLLATRQFDRAGEEFLKAVEDPANTLQRLDALRRWLLLYTRVHPAPQEAIKVLNRIRSEVQLSAFEEQEVKSWLESLRRWQNESKVKLDPLRKAQHLINQGVAVSDTGNAAQGTVELLRGTAILHQLMSDSNSEGKDQRGEVLYLLGVAYGALPPFFADELPEVFLEQCIRENPGTELARRAYSKLTDIISLGYTGSGGTKLPAEVVALFKELHAIAYGEPSLSGRI